MKVPTGVARHFVLAVTLGGLMLAPWAVSAQYLGIGGVGQRYGLEFLVACVWRASLVLRHGVGCALWRDGGEGFNGKWRIFGWRPPTVIVGPDGQTNLMYRVSF